MRSALLALLLLACGGGEADPERSTSSAGGEEAAAPRVEPAPNEEAAPHEDGLFLVESFPLGTSLDHADIADAGDVWVELIDGAERRVDLLHFYGATAPGSAGERVLEALERASARGVTLRLVFDAGFHGRMPEVPDRLAALPTAELRLYEFPAGGVQHTKLFLVDGRVAYVGSQNLDWRSLEHIQELGLKLTEPRLVAAVQDLFELDWALAGGASLEDARAALPAREVAWPITTGFRDAPVEVTPAFSPEGWLPPGAVWDWPRLEAAIDGAGERVRLQVMSYHLHGYDGGEWRAFDEALRRAAGRGVRVEVIVSHWEQRPDRVEDLKALQRVPNVEVRFATIPEAASGFIPYARTVHAKYLTVDGAFAWVGTSNASGDYFTKSRNAGFLVRGAPFAARLDAFFEDLWASPYAATVDPEREYEAPRVGE
ncbi:MAG TPA: phospholipase D-like domain-containing protein [Polyangiaceae bacterium LLY-WYZ-15_(1-7)]|nr:phospholipase D-like domain-containing protein [Polyangiaceae bacterium LLY-WYZ-15_(1-7)]HJL06531.1 phospholipase D-like domain-containing protein [Polyangiaceae bacterium LLY-WYZ-15_(1-7)]HJL12586.1 phospholipase D-like domain-containing protein [Polyangiaceae bacterium LLY-WYZ-15_(1-7)]HJL27466.1 phospholipase D-like domain-containing protein [Polyangiaceae bacterium LLY-WYZ-15_(1-7)]HJL37391.1 phospholipase D-like domain-containing protein [Polyangiaceae bacterium LLY-WYZ-15_(1-7)]